MRKLMNWTKEEEHIIKDNFNKKTLKQIMALMPRSFNYSTFREKCQTMGFYRDKSKIKIPVSSTYNQEHWKDLNIIKTWMAGLISADGCIRKNKYNTYIFTILLSKNDECLIDSFIKELDYKGKKTIITRNVNGKEKKYVSISVSSFHKNAEYLMQHFNLGERKTKRLRPTNLLNENLNWAYFIGAIDGDGTISQKIIKKDKGRRIQKSINLIMTSSAKEIMKWYKDLIDTKFPCHLDYSVNLSYRMGAYKLGYTGLRAAIIINYLRKFPLENYRLARKWDNPEVLAYIAEKKAQYPEYFIEPDAAELAALMPQVAKPEEYQPQISLPLL